ncbi:MAG: amidohydrolase [Planctomycetes bacterium]|nr:amidohydrolase [Planctomycetota bacterium]
MATPETRPDLIVCGSRVQGVDGCDAVAITGDRITAVGGRAGMLALRGPETLVLDRPRALVCAGFHDAHAHLLPLAEARMEIDLHGLDLGRIRDAVAAAAAKAHPSRWIVGRGFDPELFRASGTTARALLDPVAAKHPVLLRSHDYHAVAMNSAGLLATGFLPPMPGSVGVIDTDSAGEPTGILRELAAMAASAQCNDRTPEEASRAAIEASFELARAGITALHDMSGSRPHELLRTLDEMGCLPLDVFATLSPQDTADPAAVADATRPGRRFRVVGMKTFLDGALGSRTAHLLEPYEDDACHRGVEVVSKAQAIEAVTAAAAAGVPSYLHAIGDAAVRTALDVLAATRDPQGRRLRHRIEHAQMIHDADLPRFAASGIVASLQPVHMALDAPLVHRHWGSRSREAFPVRRLLDSGARVAFGSDTPIETFDVAQGLACAVLRTGRDGTVLHAEEAVTVTEAIDAYTSGAAWAAGVERDCGTIRTGALASLTLLSEDVVRHPAALADVRCAATIVRGEVLHEIPA